MLQDQQFRTPTIRIGCSGWQYGHWRGTFYPRAWPQSRWLEYYAERFDTVEINNTFYRLPDASTFAAWGRRVPRGSGLHAAVDAGGSIRPRARDRHDSNPRLSRMLLSIHVP